MHKSSSFLYTSFVGRINIQILNYPESFHFIGEGQAICSGPVADPGHPRMARAIRGWPGIRDWPGKTGPVADPWMAWLCSGPVADPWMAWLCSGPVADPWMAWLCSGPVADPGHPRMARATHG